MFVSLVLVTNIFLRLCSTSQAFYIPHFSSQARFTIKEKTPRMSASSDVQSQVLSWEQLKANSADQAVGNALNKEVEKRKSGKGSAHVQSKLRLFSSEEKPKITLYRDHAGCKF